jgi:copper chaperone CopZ
MKKVLFTGILLSLLASCSTSTDQVFAKEKDQKEKVTEDELVAVIPNRKMTTEIDGMTCVMGCGGSIRKELLKTGGVSRCSFDFKGMGETSTAMIEFDKDKISADEIAAIIQKINDNQFTLGKMSTETIEMEAGEDTKASASTEKEEITPINVSSSSGIQLPNFIDLISELLIH